jgi:hypothetical protein
MSHAILGVPFLETPISIKLTHFLHRSELELVRLSVSLLSGQVYTQLHIARRAVVTVTVKPRHTRPKRRR